MFVMVGLQGNAYVKPNIRYGNFVEVRVIGIREMYFDLFFSLLMITVLFC